MLSLLFLTVHHALSFLSHCFFFFLLFIGFVSDLSFVCYQILMFVKCSDKLYKHCQHLNVKPNI